MAEVISRGREVAGKGQHSEIHRLPTNKKITEKEAGHRINASPAIKRLTGLFHTPPAPPCSKQFVNCFLNTKEKKTPDLDLTSVNE